MSKLFIVADKFEIVSLHSSGSIDNSINSTPEVDLDIKEWEWVNKDNDEEVYESLTTLTRSLSICVGKGGRNKKKYSKSYRHSKAAESIHNSIASVSHNNNNELNVSDLDFDDSVFLKNKENEPDIPLLDCIFVAGLYHDHLVDIQVPFTKDVFPADVSTHMIIPKTYLECGNYNSSNNDSTHG